MSIIHVGWYHEVLTQPAGRRAGTITILRDDATTAVIELKTPSVRLVAPRRT